MRARLFVLLAAVLWSTSGAAIKLCHLSGPQIASARSAVAALAILVLVPASRRWPSRKAWWVGAAYAATVGLYALANKLTTAANAIFLQDTAPLWVMLVSLVWLKQRPSRAELVAAPVFGLGLALLFVEDLAPGQALGNGLALAAGVAFALTIVGLHREPGESTSMLVAGNVIAALVFAPFGLDGPVPTALDVGLVTFLGVVQLALAYLAFARGIRELPAVEASLLALLEPVLNPIWTWALANEQPSRWTIAGGALILGASVWRIATSRNSAKT